MPCECYRCEGAAENQLRVVAEAPFGEFVGTLRLEEETVGAYTWRSIFMDWFRSVNTAYGVAPSRDDDSMIKACARSYI